MEITHHDQDAAVVAAPSGTGQPIGEWFATGEAIATELRGHGPGAVYDEHDDVTPEVDAEAVVDAAARKVGRRDASVNIVRAVAGPR